MSIPPADRSGPSAMIRDNRGGPLRVRFDPDEQGGSFSRNVAKQDHGAPEQSEPSTLEQASVFNEHGFFRSVAASNSQAANQDSFQKISDSVQISAGDTAIRPVTLKPTADPVSAPRRAADILGDWAVKPSTAAFDIAVRAVALSVHDIGQAPSEQAPARFADDVVTNAVDDGGETPTVLKANSRRPVDPNAATRTQVAFHRSSDVAAVSVRTDRLSRTEQDALRDDIVKLLAHYGLVLGDLHLNGQPAPDERRG